MLYYNTVKSANNALKDISEPSILIPVFKNDYEHVTPQDLILLYLYTTKTNKEIVIVINHTEAVNLLDFNDIQIPKNIPLYIYNKKRFNKCIDQSNFYELNLFKYFATNSNFEEDYDTPAHLFFQRKFFNLKNLNSLVPLSKHMEKCNRIVEDSIQYIDYEIDDPMISYNEILNVLNKIEESGLYVNYNSFSKKYDPKLLKNNYVYSDYNIYTTTGRPSNRANKINFGALNKEDNTRAIFTSRWGKDGFILSYDYDAYHLRLLSNMLDVPFDKDINVHEYFGKLFFNKTELTEEEYDKAKQVNFKILYGGIPKEYQHIEFFALAKEFSKNLWKEFNKNDFIETKIYKRKLYKKFFPDITSNKLFNYYIQSYETERNMFILNKLFKKIKKYQSKLILYTYDSFVFDFNKKDGAEFIKLIKEELEENQFSTKLYIGPDYQNLIQVYTD